MPKPRKQSSTHLGVRKNSLSARIPSELKTVIIKRLGDGMTIDEMVMLLQAHDIEASRAAAGSLRRDMVRQAEHLQETMQIAKTVAARVSNMDAAEMSQVLTQLMTSRIFEMVGRDTAETPEEMLQLASAVQRVAQAQKLTNAEAERIKAEARKEAVDAVKKVSKKQGLPKAIVTDLVKAIKASR